MMKTKRLFALLCAALLVCALIAPASAAAGEPAPVVVDLGDGFYAVETVTYGPMSRSGSTVSGSKTASIYHESLLVGTATLSAQFDTSGSSAVAISAFITGAGYNGWSYSHGTASGSGNTAYGTAYFTNGLITKHVTVTLSCSPGGTLV